MATTNKSAADLTTFLTELRDLCNRFLGEAESGGAPAKRTPAKKAVAKPAPEPVEEEVADDPRAELASLSLAELRKRVSAMDLFSPADVKAADKDSLIDTILEYSETDSSSDGDDEDVEDDDTEDEAAEEEEDADDDGEEEAEEEDGEYSREDLEALGLRELKKIAVEQGYSNDDLKGLTKADVIATILQEDEEGDDEEDEVEEEEVEDDDTEEEADEEVEGEWYTKAELNGQSLAELKALAKEYGVALKPGMKKPALVSALFALGQ